MAPLSKMKVSDVDIEILVQVIREAGRPVHVNKLAREFVRARLLTETREARRYTPEGVTLDTSDLALRTTEEVEEEEPEEQETTIPEDLEAWRRNRRRNATITLRASYYYGNWLRLIKDMQRVFPPRASGADSVTFYHRFGGEEESFQAWVDWNQGRILGSSQMYQAFYDYGIYPGAVLVISHRENEQEYDIRTKPPTKDETVRVRRIFFATDENGNRILDEYGHPKLEYEEVDEPLRYDVADEVFIVGASWEKLPELFAEAERVGQGYFGLMYEVCCEWWEANGRKPLYVTADELFQEIHYNRRLVTSDATIPWELWRRLAFKPVGDGRYLFRPEMGDRTRAVGPSRRPARTPKKRREVMAKRDKSLLEIANTQVGKVTLTEEGVSTDNKRERLKTEFKQIDWDEFIDECHEHSGHWAIVPRVIFFNQRGITQTFKALALLVEEFMGSIWDVDTKHKYTQRMIEEHIIQARGPINKVSDAHARIRDNLFRYLGLAFLESGSVVSESHITEVGNKFLKTTNLIERKAVLEQQLIKLHFWNPVIPNERYGNFQVRPFALLLQLLIHLDTQSLSSEEYNLFLSRAQSMVSTNEVIIKQIRGE